MLPTKSSASVRHLCCCKRAGFWLLSEQSDREANECWLNRWVVTLLHWRGFTGDMMHCFTKVVGRQWARSVGCLCVKCQSVSISKARGVADMCSPQNLNWCLHNSTTALALFHWHFMTSQKFLFRPPHVSFGIVDAVLSVTEWAAGVDYSSIFAGSSFSAQVAEKEVIFSLKEILTVPPVSWKQEEVVLYRWSNIFLHQPCFLP